MDVIVFRVRSPFPPYLSVSFRRLVCRNPFSIPRFPVTRQALTVYQECLGPQHGDVGSALNLLAVVVGEQGRHVEVRLDGPAIRNGICYSVPLRVLGRGIFV